MERIKSRTAEYQRRLDSMDAFLEYRAGQEIKKLRSRVLGDKQRELAKRGECKKGWMKVYEASGEMDRDIEAARLGIVYLRPGAASDPEIIREYEAEKAAVRLTEIMENGCFNELSVDVDLLTHHLIDYFVDWVREAPCGACTWVGDIPSELDLRDTDGKRIEIEYDQENFKGYFEYLVDDRLGEDFVQQTLTDITWSNASDDHPAVTLLHKWFLEQNPNISELLAKAPSCGAVDSYIQNYVKTHIPMLDFITGQICEAFNSMSEDAYLELNFENDDKARDMYKRYVLDT